MILTKYHPLKCLFYVVFTYLLIGIFPFEYYETDALGITSGVQKIKELKKFGANFYTYNYNVQIGIYFWVYLIHNLCSFSIKISASLVSALFGILFYLFSALFISRTLRINFYFSALCLLLFQEIYSSWYYINAATPAAFFMIIGLHSTLITQKFWRIVFVAVFFGIAAWSKLDVMITFLVIIFLLPGKSVLNRFWESTMIALLTIVFLLILSYASNATIISELLSGSKGGSLSFTENQKTAESLIYSQIFKTLIGYFTILIVFCLSLGTYEVLRQKK